MDRSNVPPVILARDLMAADLPQRRFLLDPLLTTKTLALLYGPRGLGKTFVAMGIAWAVASGGSFLGWRADKPARVVYLDGEMAAADMRDRLGLFGPVPDRLEFMLADLGTGSAIPDLGSIDGQHTLMAMLGGWPDLLVIDNLASLAGLRTRDPDPWRQVQTFLLILRRVRTAVLVVHHANKQGLQRGTSRREDIVDLVMAIRRPADYRPSDGARFELHFEKARSLHGPATDPIEARLAADADGHTRWSWRNAEAHELHRVAALLGEGLNPYQIARQLGISKSKAYRLREQVVSSSPL
jgi:putative DNA primase/helicase